MKTNTDLAEKMMTRADADLLSTDHELRISATAFDKAAKGFYSDPQTCTIQNFMRCWVRARRIWSEYSGEKFI